jgi:enediyne biosynthesis protein E4
MRWSVPVLLVLLMLTGCRRSASSPSRPLAPAGQPSIRFDDATAASGIRFTHFTGADGRFLMPESVGCGGAFIDYDSDGWLDVFLVNSSSWPDRPQAGKSCALYRNNGNGTFSDVTRQAGLHVPMYGQGCAVGDFDNDGDSDLLLTCLGPNRLFRNTGHGGFEDATPGSGLEAGARWAWHTGAAWTDYDRDGLLDLFVCRYVKWSPQTDVPCRSGSGKRTYCGPNQYTPDGSMLYRNLGNGKFRDVSKSTGISASQGKALGVLPLDENGDGWTDLVITNDTSPNHLFRNQAGRRFQEEAAAAGIAVDDMGKARAGMGVDVGDVRNDGGLHFAIGNFSREGLSLYERGDVLYTDVAARAGLAAPSLRNVTFGLLFLDGDRDGWQDLFAYNGHVDPQIAEAGGGVTHLQKPLLLRNEGGSFTDVTAAGGAALQKAQVGRGCAWGDWNNDGRPDLLLCENGGPARLLKNATGDGNHWLGIRLRGRGNSRGNRDGYGAEVRVTADGNTQRRWVRSGGSYLSHSDTRALFGLAGAAVAQRVEVRWPSGRSTVQEAVVPDRYIEVAEGP